MSNKKINIGLFGFGIVGEGIYKVLNETSSLNATVRRICVKNPYKPRNAPDSFFTTDSEVILNDPRINVIVEAIDDADAAYIIVKNALIQGKSVVSANKKMIAEHLTELLSFQKEYCGSLLYEAAACASIPVIRNLEEYYDNDMLHKLSGIINGSTNYILTRMADAGTDLKTALNEAQESGFAESDPSLDVNGFDAVNKFRFLLTHAYGIIPKPGQLLFNGIQNIKRSDLTALGKRNFSLKLVAHAEKLTAGKIAAYVLPQFIEHSNPLSYVRHEFNGVIIGSSFADEQFFYGKGAGSFPTASALLSDISALRYGYRYEYKKLYQHVRHELTNDFYLKVYISFSDLESIPLNEIDNVLEWPSGEERNYLSGVIHYSKLQKADWWKKNGVSLILHPDAVITADKLESLKRRKFELVV